MSLFIGSLSVFSCARSPVKDREQALRPIATPFKNFRDDLGWKNLANALEKNIHHLEEKKNTTELQFGKQKVSKSLYLEKLRGLKREIEKDPSGTKAQTYLNEHFQQMEVYGQEEYGDVLVTGYYDPVMKGSRTPNQVHTEPLYKMPKDLISVRFDLFLKARPKLRLAEDIPFEQKSKFKILRGRINDEGQLVPYFDRRQIAEEQALSGRNLEIVWVDPIDAFFLQIQGSGTIELENGEQIRVGYAAQNGHPYRAIGRVLFDVIPREEMSMQRIRDHLKTLNPDEQNAIFRYNPSYVFFQEQETQAVTFSGIEAIEGRSIATDYSLFPKGALAYLEFEKPHFNETDSPEKSVEWIRTHRFVLDHDTGGAIRGAGRLDLYWGSGNKAAKHAGVMKQRGKLYYLAPKR